MIDINMINEIADSMQLCMTEICINTRFSETLMKNTKQTITDVYGNMNLLLGIEEIQELLVEIKKFELNLQDKNINHLTEEFTDCMILLNFISYSYEIKLCDIFDIKSRMQEIFSKENEELIRLMIVEAIHNKNTGIKKAELVLLEIAKNFSKYIRAKRSKEELTKCLKDMQIVLYCIKSYFNLDLDKIHEWTKRKMKKTEKRNISVSVKV